MQFRRLFVGGFQALRRPVNVVDQSLMTRIEKAREQLRREGKDVVAVLGRAAERETATAEYTHRPATTDPGSDFRRSA